MSLELDHFFILTEPGAPAASLLSDIGLIEGIANDHPGQGTSNRRFFFSDSMLELLYIRDAREATVGPGSRLHLAERIADSSASPFGLVFRETDGSTSEYFPGWQYYPEYLSAEQYFHVGKNSGQIDEPLCIVLPQTFSQPIRQPGNGRFDSVTEVRVSFPSRRTSPVLEAVAQCRMLSLISGVPHLMEVVFNGNREHQAEDLRPFIPLTISW
jgi:hypothetical protein